MPREPFRDPSEPLFEQRINELEEGKVNKETITAERIGAEAVTTAKIKNEAVTNAKVGPEAVGATKAQKPSIPVASGTESLTAEGGFAGVARSILFVYNAKKEASAKIKIKHELGTEYVQITAWKASAKKATEQALGALAGAVSAVKTISANETEVTLVAAEPTAKEEIFYIVTG